jgi:hypothetical protein
LATASVPAQGTVTKHAPPLQSASDLPVVRLNAIAWNLAIVTVIVSIQVECVDLRDIAWPLDVIEVYLRYGLFFIGRQLKLVPERESPNERNSGSVGVRRIMAVRRRGEPRWANFSTEELLKVRFCDLDLRLERSPLWERIERLYEELAERDLNFRPHCWLAEEWFSPDGVPGIAIPFYLAHPRLARLEKQQMLEVEGGTETWCMKILRHEAGHTLDTAYRLHRRLRYRQIFGKASEPYPEFYQPKPYSRSFVLHLDLWYAQSHPAEDFAETFAVWLRPRSPWRSRYHDWPAFAKLEYVDDLMQEIAGAAPTIRSTRHIESIRENRRTLGEHYAEKRRRYRGDAPPIYDRELRRLFSNSPENAKRPSAAAFLRGIRVKLRRVVAHWTGQYQYVINQVLSEMIERCRELNLRLATPARQAERDALVMVTVQTMNYLHAGHHRVAL